MSENIPKPSAFLLIYRINDTAIQLAKIWCFKRDSISNNSDLFRDNFYSWI